MANEFDKGSWFDVLYNLYCTVFCEPYIIVMRDYVGITLGPQMNTYADSGLH